MTELTILFRDSYLVAIDKPPGMLVHRTGIASRETTFAVQTLRDQIGRIVYPVHRLDRGTSGVLLFALTSEMARLVSAEIVERRVDKQYTALVRGWCDDSGRIEMPLEEKIDPRSDRRPRTVKPAQEAVTEFATVQRFELPIDCGRFPTSRYSLLNLTPKTGRRHQIRRHLKHAAHPIVGDREHGDHRHNQSIERHFDVRRMLLVAHELQIRHPVSGETITLQAPLGPEFQTLLGRFREQFEVGPEH